MAPPPKKWLKPQPGAHFLPFSWNPLFYRGLKALSEPPPPPAPLFVVFQPKRGLGLQVFFLQDRAGAGHGTGQGQQQQHSPNNRPQTTTTQPPRSRKKGGSETRTWEGGWARKEAVWKNSPFSVNPPLGLPCVPLGFFFSRVFLGLLAPKLGFLGFWPLASGFSPGFWLCWLLFAFSGSTQ